MNQKLDDTKEKDEIAAFYDILVRITVHDYVNRKKFTKYSVPFYFLALSVHTITYALATNVN
jgi:hypothetical protein